MIPKTCTDTPVRISLCRQPHPAPCPVTVDKFCNPPPKKKDSRQQLPPWLFTHLDLQVELLWAECLQRVSSILSRLISYEVTHIPI